MFRILISFLFFIHCSGALALRDDLCRSLGKGLEFLSETQCREGNQAEYDLACAQSSFGQRYTHGEVRWGSYARKGYSSLGEYADGMTDEILMNLAAQNVAESNRCMVNFYSEYLADTGTAVDGVKNAFRLSKPKLEELLPPQNSPRRLSFLRPSSELVNAGRSIDIVQRDSEGGPRVKFDALIASIPLGNQEEIRNFVAKAVVENYSEQQFISGYQAEVRKLRTKHQNSVNAITAYRLNPNQPVYNVREGERGSMEIRQSLIESGAIENYIMANNLEQQFAPGYLCRRHRQERGCIALTAIEFAGSFALPYAAASIGLRAGLAMASRGVTTWNTARFVGHAISRGLLFSGYIGQLSLLTDDAVGQCLLRHPQYLQSKSVASCEPQKMVFEAASEASMADCLNTVALGLVPIGIAAIADDALRAIRVESRLNSSSSVAPVAPIGTAEEIPEIVVTGYRNRNPLSEDGREILSSTSARLELLSLERNAAEENRILQTLQTSEPRLVRGFQAAIDQMSDSDFVAAYVSRLQEETIRRMESSGSSLLRRKLEESILDQDTLLAILRERVEARGQRIVEITAEEGVLADDLFRARISSGYLIDRGVNRSHGRYTHLIQQDMLFDLICRESGVSQAELFRFFGTENGKKVWDDMFDSMPSFEDGFGERVYKPRSLRSPETMTILIMNQLQLD